MSNIIVKENETLDSALRRFKRSCAKAGIQQEIHSYCEKKSFGWDHTAAKWKDAADATRRR